MNENLFGYGHVYMPKEMICIFGFEKAYIIQELNMLLVNTQTNLLVMIDNIPMVCMSLDDWASCFPFWSKRTTQHHLIKLEKLGVVKSIQPGGQDRRKCYWIDRDKVYIYFGRGERV